MITKEICRDYALKIKEETGKFPVEADWVVKNGYPTSRATIKKLFNSSYNNFRDYCGEPHKIRKELITLDWIRSNCIIDENNCWNWSRTLSKTGYGQLKIDNKQLYSHRVAYTLTKGVINEKLLIRHKCDNRKCCNPEHLESGSYSDNALDNVIRNSNYNPRGGTIYGRLLVNKTLNDRITFYLTNIDVVNNNCYISNILKQNNDYYQINFHNNKYYLHRLILAEKLKKKYDDIFITRHTCDNKKCINPDHLVEGTKSENSLDSMKYSRVAKLSKENVIEIKKELQLLNMQEYGIKTVFDEFWATKFNVNPNTIKHIRLGKTWKNI